MDFDSQPPRGPIASPGPDGTVHDGTLYVADGVLQVFAGGDEGDGDPAENFFGQANGLLGTAQPGYFVTITGAQHGDIPYVIQVLDQEPADDGFWEEVVEAPFTPLDDRVSVSNFDGSELATFAVENGTSYRVRLSGIDMDAGADEGLIEEDDPKDRYLLQMWPAPPAPDAIVKQTSKTAAYWHDAYTS